MTGVLGKGNVFVLLRRRTLDGNTGVMGEVYLSSLGSVLLRQGSHLTTRDCSLSLRALQMFPLMLVQGEVCRSRSYPQEPHETEVPPLSPSPLAQKGSICVRDKNDLFLVWPSRMPLAMGVHLLFAF